MGRSSGTVSIKTELRIHENGVQVVRGSNPLTPTSVVSYLTSALMLKSFRSLSFGRKFL